MAAGIRCALAGSGRRRGAALTGERAHPPHPAASRAPQPVSERAHPAAAAAAGVVGRGRLRRLFVPWHPGPRPQTEPPPNGAPRPPCLLCSSLLCGVHSAYDAGVGHVPRLPDQQQRGHDPHRHAEKPGGCCCTPAAARSPPTNPPAQHCTPAHPSTHPPTPQVYYIAKQFKSPCSPEEFALALAKQFVKSQPRVWKAKVAGARGRRVICCSSV